MSHHRDRLDLECLPDHQIARIIADAAEVLRQRAEARGASSAPAPGPEHGRGDAAEPFAPLGQSALPLIDPDLIEIARVAKVIGRSKETARRWAHRNHLTVRIPGLGRVYVSERRLREFLASRQR